MVTRYKHKGAVALEFIMLFPFVIAMLYASATYGITFFAKYKMQDAVDRAVASALYVDRSESEAGTELKDAVEGRALDTLTSLRGTLPDWQAQLADPICDTPEEGGIAYIRCSLTYADYNDNPIVPTMSFGMLGTFPPLPGELKTEARAAF